MIIDHQQKQTMRFHACERRMDEYIRQRPTLPLGIWEIAARRGAGNAGVDHG